VTDKSFDWKLEQVLVRRLRDGHAPEALRAELRGRLVETEADAILSRAETRARALQAGKERVGGDLGVRVLTGVAYAWTVVLIIQHLTIIWTLVPFGLNPRLESGRMALFAALKVLGLCAAFLAFKRWRTIHTTGCYGLAIAYAFPLGAMLEGWAVDGRPNVGLLWQASALISYITVGTLFAAYRLGRPRPAGEGDDVAAFD